MPANDPFSITNPASPAGATGAPVSVGSSDPTLADEYLAWCANRRRLWAQEESEEFPNADDWAGSDDTAVAMLERAMSALGVTVGDDTAPDDPDDDPYDDV